MSQISKDAWGITLEEYSQKTKTSYVASSGGSLRCAWQPCSKCSQLVRPLKTLILFLQSLMSRFPQAEWYFSLEIDTVSLPVPQASLGSSSALHLTSIIVGNWRGRFLLFPRTFSGAQELPSCTAYLEL